MALKLPGLFGTSELFNRQPGDGEVEARFGNRKEFYDEELGQPEFYDEFLGSALKTQRWTEDNYGDGSISVSSSLAVLDTGETDTSVAKMYSVRTFSPAGNYKIIRLRARVKMNLTAANEATCYFGLMSAQNSMIIGHWPTNTLNTAKAHTADDTDSTDSSEFGFLEGEYNMIEIVYRLGERVEYWVNGICVASHVTPLPTLDEEIGAQFLIQTGAEGQVQNLYVDWCEIYIR